MSAALPTEATADSARRLAAAILSERRFRSPSVPRPLHGFLHAVGSALTSVGHAMAHLVDRVGKLVPGGAVTVWVLLAIVLVAAVVIIARRRAQARTSVQLRTAAQERRERAEELERQADHAERDGHFAEAVRLRFRAGVARLSEEGEFPLARSTPNGQLARSLRSADFDALARRFDEIAYGSSPADPEDVEEARRRWRAVAAGARP